MDYLVEHDVILEEADAVEAIGRAGDRREELEKAKREKELNAATSRIKGTGLQKGEIGVTNKGRNAQKVTKLQASMLLSLGRQMLLAMQCLLALVGLLCVLCVAIILKK